MTSKARRTIASVAAAVMLAAPAAQAMPMDPQTGRPAHMSSTPSIGMEYGDLRRDPTTSVQPTIEPAPAPASGGFDWIAAAIGAVVVTGLALGSWTALRARRPVGRRAVA